MNRKNIVNAICIFFIVASAIVIAKSLYSLKYDGEADDHSELEMKRDPLTSVDFDDRLINIGDVPPDTMICQGYTFRNIGDKPLVVYFVSPDCNCTDYSISKKIALPGDSLRIDLTVDTKNKKNRFMLNTVVRMNTKESLYVLRLEGNIVEKNS